MKNPRGDLSVELDFLAKKFEQDAGELLGAFEECGLQAPAQSDEKGGVVDHDGSLYWLERDKRGRVWVNTRDKKFKTAKTTAVPVETSHETRPEPAAASAAPAREPHRETGGPSEPKSFLGRIRSMMRRNHRGHGWSGSFPYLTRALKLDEAGLLEKLGEQGLKLPPEGETKPVFTTEGDFVFWLNRNQRGEIWINAQLARDQEQSESVGRGLTPTSDAVVSGVKPDLQKATLPPENTLTAVRLLMQPKKRGEGVTAQVKELALQLEKADEQLFAALAQAGLNVPESPKAKPTFAEHGGEIFWLNVNAKGQVWLNAKAVAVKKSFSAAKAAADKRTKKSGE